MDSVKGNKNDSDVVVFGLLRLARDYFHRAVEMNPTADCIHNLAVSEAKLVCFASCPVFCHFSYPLCDTQIKARIETNFEVQEKLFCRSSVLYGQALQKHPKNHKRILFDWANCVCISFPVNVLLVPLAFFSLPLLCQLPR